MNGFQVWRLHRALKMHFTTRKYDLFQYNGRFYGDDEIMFKKLNHKMLYEMMSVKFENPHQAVEFFLSNLLYTRADEAFTLHAWDNYKRWIREKESLTKLIADDLGGLDLSTDLHDDVLPKLLKLIVGGKIMPQTAVAIDAVIPFLADWDAKVYFGHEESVLKLIKLKRFVKYNTELIAQLIVKKQCEK